jgi:hypothetical protein
MRSSAGGGIPFGQCLQWSLGCVVVVTVVILVINISLYQSNISAANGYDDAARNLPKILDYSKLNQSSSSQGISSLRGDPTISSTTNSGGKKKKGDHVDPNKSKSKSNDNEQIIYKTKCSSTTILLESPVPITKAPSRKQKGLSQAVNNNGFSFPIPKFVFDTNLHSNSSSSSSSSSLHAIELASSYNVQIAYDTALFNNAIPKSSRNEELSRFAMDRFCQRKSTIRRNTVDNDQSQQTSKLSIKQIEISLSSKHDLSQDVLKLISRFHGKDISSIQSFLARLEAYLLVVREDGTVTIVANAAQGVNYALNTLSELIFSPTLHYLPLEVVDYAEKDWRGKLCVDIQFFCHLK